MTDSYKALLYTPHAQVCADYWRQRAMETPDRAINLRAAFRNRAQELAPVWSAESADIMRSTLYEDFWTRAVGWRRPNE